MSNLFWLMDILSLLILLIVGLSVAYLYLLALAAIRMPPPPPRRQPTHRFAIAIPAHNEEAVVGRTMASLHQLDYPTELFTVYVVADHCSDSTAQVATAHGAICYERNVEPRGNKGAALGWLLEKIFGRDFAVDAIVFLDADVRIDKSFLKIMDVQLTEGAKVIQGRDWIANPHSGWYPALAWAIYTVDNRYQNLGRSNLGFSSRLMGYLVCFKSEVLRLVPLGADLLTEDYDLRARLLLHGIRIQYEPHAIGYGEAPATWAIARHQRVRWLAGTYQGSRRYAGELLREGLHRHDLSLLDGAAQMLLPSYSTLTVMSFAILVLQLSLNAFFGPLFSPVLLVLWALITFLLGIYPFFALVLERAPLRIYLVVLSGPIFVVWRTWLALVTRFGRKPVTWIRTPRQPG